MLAERLKIQNYRIHTYEWNTYKTRDFHLRDHQLLLNLWNIGEISIIEHEVAWNKSGDTVATIYGAKYTKEKIPETKFWYKE